MSYKTKQDLAQTITVTAGRLPLGPSDAQCKEKCYKISYSNSNDIS